MSVRVYKRFLKDGERVVFDLDVYESGRRARVTVTKPVQLSRKRDVERARRDAEVKAREVEEQLRVDPYSFFEKKRRDHSDFIEYCRALAKERGNPAAWTGMINRLAEFAGGPVRMQSVDAIFGQRFRRYLLGVEGIGNTTKKNNLATFKAAIRQAVKDGYLNSFDIADRIDNIKADDARQNFCTVEQLRRLDAESCSYPAVKVAFLFSCFTGLRLSDVQALKFNDIRRDNGRLYLAYRQKKTKKNELLPLGAQAVHYLNQATELHVYEADDDERVFAGLPSDTAMRRVLRDWGETAELPFSLHFHAARHTFITLGMSAGINSKVLSGLAGHSSVAMTEKYMHLVNPDRIAGMDALPVIGGAAELGMVELSDSD